MRFSTASRRRRGITLVEVMVALVLVAVGLLGIAGTSALLVRATVAQAGERAAIRRAGLRLAQLGAAGCAAARDGSSGDASALIRERWQLGAATNGVRLLDHTIEWTARGRIRRLSVRSALLC